MVKWFEHLKKTPHTYRIKSAAHNVICRHKALQPMFKVETYSIYDLKFFLHRKIRHKERDSLVQCLNCWTFRHTTTYCRHLSVCVMQPIEPLEDLILEVWSTFRPEMCRKYMLSLPSRLSWMSQNNGSHSGP